MKLSLMLLVLVAGVGGLLGEEIKMADGEAVAFTSVKRTEPDGLVVLTESGVSKIHFSKMSKEAQQQYGYDPQKAVSYANEFKRSEAARYQQLVEQVAAREKELPIAHAEDQNRSSATAVGTISLESNKMGNNQDVEFDMSLIENEPITENLGIVGKRVFIPPITEKGRGIFIKIPLIQTREGITRDAENIKNYDEGESLRKWMTRQSWMAGNIATCSSMVLNSFGDKVNPREVYCWASGEQYAPTKDRYTWEDYWYSEVAAGIGRIGYQWVFKSPFRNTSFDFQAGIQEIKNNLDKGCPVIVSVTWNETRRDKFRAVIINGYDDSTKRVYITDPSIASPGLRIISYKNLEKICHTLDGTDIRYIMLTSFKK